MVNTVEYELILYTFLTVLDIIFGTYSHVFVKKDSSSTAAKAGVLKKLMVLVFMATCVCFYDIERFIPMDSVLVNSALINDIKSIIIAIVAYMCYFEFISVAANFSMVTGVDLTKIPGVASELEKKERG